MGPNINLGPLYFKYLKPNPRPSRKVLPWYNMEQKLIKTLWKPIYKVTTLWYDINIEGYTINTYRERN